MTTKEFNKLDKTFNITPEVIEEETTSLGRSTPPPDRLTKDDIEKDYEYTRGNLYSIIEKGQEAIDGILELAQESEQPRAYEVAGQLIKTVGEVTEKLADLQEKMKRLKEVPDHAPKNVTNALFVGSTKELQALLSDERPSIASQIENE